MEYPTKFVDDIKAAGKSSIAIGPFGSRMKSDCYVLDGIPVIRGNNLSDTITFKGNFVFIAEELANQIKSANVYAGDLVFPHRWAIGEVGIVPLNDPSRYVLSTSLMKLTCDTGQVNPLFLFYFFRSKYGRHELLKNASQVGTPGISTPLTSLKEVEIPVPKLEEQENIAEILSSLDEKIELNRKQNRTLEAIAQALFKRWFVEFEFPYDFATGQPDPNGQPYKSSGGAMQPSELGEIPVGWEVAQIGDYVEVTDYVANGSFESLRNNVTLYDTSEFAIFVRATDYKGGFSGGLKYTDKSSYEFLKKTVLTGDEIIISNVGDIGSVFRPPVWLDQPMTLGSNLIALRSDFNSYLFQLFRSYYGQFLISALVGGSAQPKFNKTEFRSLEVVLPSRAVLEQYAEIELALWDKQIACNRGGRTLSCLRDTLLPKLMSGELRVGDAA